MKNFLKIVKYNSVDFILIVLVLAAGVGNLLTKKDYTLFLCLFFIGYALFNVTNKFKMQNELTKYVSTKHFKPPLFSQIIQYILIVCGIVLFIFIIYKLLNI